MLPSSAHRPTRPGRARVAASVAVSVTRRAPALLTLFAAIAVSGCGAGGAIAGPAPTGAAGSVTSPITSSAGPTATGSVASSGPGMQSAPSTASMTPPAGSAASAGADIPPPSVPDGSPLQRWLSAPVVEIAHHGGSASWPPASPLAYRNAIAWNPALALEFSARRTSDGVWVGSENATTGAVYGTDLTIADSTWEQLSGLRSTDGGQPMSRLDTDLLDVAPVDRVLFVDDKDDAHVGELLDLLDQHGGAGRSVIKSYWKSVTTPTEAHRRGYLTWGYFYADEMDQFAAAQRRFDFLGIDVDAPAATYQQMLATGKRVIAHIVKTPAQADRALAAGATGLMISGVQQVVPQG